MDRSRPVTKTELALLRLLWNRQTATIRELTDRLYPDSTHAEYATVQSLLDRLERKACVRREKRGRLNVYTATVQRSDLLARRLRDTAEALCEGSLAPLLSHLVQASDPTTEELAALEGLMRRLSKEHSLDGRDSEETP